MCGKQLFSQVPERSFCFCFNVVSRRADAFGLYIPGPEAFEAGAKYLLARLPLSTLLNRWPRFLLHVPAFRRFRS
jgi:hypothetical protein